MNSEFTVSQKRALAVVTLLGLVFAAYFLRNYFILIVVAAVGAYLFTPLFNWFNKRFSKGMSATLTVLAALASVVIPIGLLVTLAVFQITRMVNSVAHWVAETDMSKLGERALAFINELLGRIPFVNVTVTPELLRERMVAVAQKAGEWLLGFLQSAAGSVVGAVIAAIIFLYVFVSLLVSSVVCS